MSTDQGGDKARKRRKVQDASAAVDLGEKTAFTTPEWPNTLKVRAHSNLLLDRSTSISQDRGETSNLSAVQRALTTYELVENILTFASVRTIQSASKVSTAFRSVVRSSPTILHLGVLQPARESIFPIYAQGILTPEYDFEERIAVHPIFSAIHAGPGATLRMYPSPKRHWDLQTDNKHAFVTSPPVKAIYLNVSATYNEPAPTTTNRQIHSCVYAREGVKIGDLLHCISRVLASTADKKTSLLIDARIENKFGFLRRETGFVNLKSIECKGRWECREDVEERCVKCKRNDHFRIFYSSFQGV